MLLYAPGWLYIKSPPNVSDGVRRQYSMRCARDMCEGICNKKILHFSYYCKYGVLVFDDRTGSTDESKRTKRVQE